MPMFKAAACYPYCMAARLRGSGADGLVLYNTLDWRDRVHLMKRDCMVNTPVLSNPLKAFENGTARFMPNGTVSRTDALAAVETMLCSLDVVAGGSVVSGKWDPNTMGCIQSGRATTIVSADSHPTYSSASGTKKRSFRSILMKEQPLRTQGTSR